MTSLRVFISRLLEPILSRRREARLRDEIDTHLELLTDDYVRRGLNSRDAAAAARRAFGGVAQVEEVHRDQRGLPLVEAAFQDIRFAVRLLARDRGFAITALAVLAVGIGVNNMLFTILNAHTLRGLPIPGVNHVVMVSTVDRRGASRGLSYPEFAMLHDASPGLSGIAAFTSGPANLDDDVAPAERMDAAFTSPSAFAVLGLQPLYGRELGSDDERDGAAAVAVMGDRTARARYGDAAGAAGRVVRINGRTTAIVGVVPERGGFPATAQIWLPIQRAPGFSRQSPARNLSVFARLGPSSSIPQVQHEVEVRFSQLPQSLEAAVRPGVVPINERFLGRLTDPAWLAFAMVGILVVLISCANVANLMLSRAVTRSRELAIRAALGASRTRLVRQLLIEGMLLAFGGGVLGLGIAVAGVRLFRSAVPENALPYWLDYSLDLRVVAALVIVSAATVFVFALVPAIRTSKTDMHSTLKDGARHLVAGRGTRRWTTVFLSAEVALTVVLLAQFAVGLRASDPGLPSDRALDTSRILTAFVTIPAERYPTADSRGQFARALTERIRNITGVREASTASVLPLSGAVERRVSVTGAGGDLLPVYSIAVGPRYFDALGQPVVRGRAFREEDGASAMPSAIISERGAERFFAGRDPIGQRIVLRDSNGAAPVELTIVGVSPSIRQRPAPTAEPVIYLPLTAGSTPDTIAVIVSGGDDAATLTPEVRGALQSLDAGIPLYRVRTMRTVLDDAQWNGRLSAALFNALVLIAVGLSTIGLYAVTAYFVGQRTQEIGVRMALGAGRSHVVRLIARRALGQLAVGFAAGVACTVAWDAMFSSGRPGLRATDAQSLAIVAGILAALAAIACLVPAARAIRLNPVDAMRHD